MDGARFVVLEGGEGSGKSTQLRVLAERLRAAGREVVETFEPGATARGAALRRFLLEDDSPLDARAELLVMAADRAQHVAEVVRPALGRGAWVVSDRFVPSSLVYQGIARGLGIEVVDQACALATGGLEPDLVIVLDVDAEHAAERRATPEDRIERAGAAFHDQVRAGYRSLAAERGWRVVDANGGADTVASAIAVVIAEAFPGSLA